MKRWELLTGLGALITMVLGRLHQVLRLLASTVVVTVRVDGEIASSLATVLSTRGWRMRSNSRAFHSKRVFLRPIRQVGPVIYENLTESSSLYWYRWRPVWLSAVVGGKGAVCSVSFLRWTITLDKFLLAAVDLKSERDSGAGGKLDRHHVIYHFGEDGSLKMSQEDTGLTPTTRVLRWRSEECGAPLRGGLAGLVLSPVTRQVATEVSDWLDSREWYYEHCVPWRHGLMLHGEPGTGKTSLARSIAEEHRLPVHVIDLTRLSNHSLRGVWQKAMSDTPCMIIIEDIDRIFVGDAMQTTEADEGEDYALTFDAFLNCIDGIEQVDGVLLVLTANHPERLDAALLRPGRIDSKVEIGRLDHATRLKLADRIVGAGPRAAKLAVDSGDVTAAVFVKMCRQLALDIRAGRTTKSADPYR